MKEDKYFDIEKRTEIRETARKLRRQFLRYQEAELVYSMTHRKLLEIAGKAGAIYRIDNTVLINRDIFNEYLEQFREPSTWKYSDQLDDMDLKMMKRDFFTYKIGMDYYGFSIRPLMRIAREAGAFYKIGKIVLINRECFDAYLRKTRCKEEKFNV